MKDHSLRVRFISLLLAGSLIVASVLLAAVEPQLPNPGTVPGATRPQQEKLGLKAMREVYKQMPVLPDSNPVSQYVQQLGRKLVAVIPPQYSWPYQFHVVQQKDINAFAIPGGPIFINIGTIDAADNEAELAGVMSHEMSHIYMQHSVKAAKKEQVPSAIAGILGGLLGAYGGALGSLAQLGVQFGAGALMMKYSREDEAQADAVGAIIMYKAGYNPEALSEFFKKIEQETGRGGPQFLSDHPNPGNREVAIQKEIRDWPPKQWLPSSQAFQQAKDEALQIKEYNANEVQQGAQQGIWARQNSERGAVPESVAQDTTGNGAGTAGLSSQPVKPSSNFTEFRHTGYRISYPDNWQIYGNEQSTVTIAPPSAVSQNAVAYGAVINQYQPPNVNESQNQVASDLVRLLKQENPGLQVIGDPQQITVNGVQGRSVDMKGTSPIQRHGSPERERDWLVALPRSDGSVLYVVFVSPEPNFSQLRPTFEQMLRTLHVQ